MEHPSIIEPNKQQLDKINILNEFISCYRLLKLYEMDNRMTLNSSTKAGEYFVSILGGVKDKEKFVVAFLDKGNNVIETKVLSEGSIGEAVVYPRAVLKAALDCDCKSMIVAHNHPGGSMVPSLQDKEITQILVSIFTPLQINVLDHIIVANNSYLSMEERGMIPKAAENIFYDPIRSNNVSTAKEVEKDFDISLDDSTKSFGFMGQDTEEESEWER
ncbi:JAB domain-containing protein [Acetivibrio cellulolyticus]